MERNDQTTSSLPSVQDAAERGAGGKFRKPPSRKPPPTPYARPPQRTRWLSKLVEPACRLISGGATRLLPSFFSKSSEFALSVPDNQQEEHHDKLDKEVEENARDDNGLNYGETILTGVIPGSSMDISKNGFDLNGYKQDKNGEQTYGNRVSEIEQLVKGKTFSRDEINRLVDILHSRAVDLPDGEQENKYLSVTVRDAMTPVPPQENPRKPINEKQEDMKKSPWGTSTALVESSVQDVGASPIDVARAYMGSRGSELGLGYKSIVSKDERASLNGDEFAIKPFIPSPSPKPSACWPGARLQDQRGYLTPRSNRDRSGLLNFPRTPYSRTIFSKSKSKLTQIQDESNRGLNISATPMQQSQTPIFEQSRRNTLDDGRGSVGPIRRTRHKVVSESPFKGSFNFSSSLTGSSLVGNTNISEVFFPAVKKNFEPGRTSSPSIFQSVDRKPPSSEVGVSPVHPHSSQMARTILEHLERNPATPKDKSAELKLATSRQKCKSSNVTSAMPGESNSVLNLGGLDSHKSSDQEGMENFTQLNEARANSFFKVPQENARKSNDTLDKTASASNTKVDSIFKLLSGNAGSSQGIRIAGDFPIKSRNENDSIPVSSAADVGLKNLQRKTSSHYGGTKPVLPSISVSKPEQRWTFSSDNSTGFSFPVSASTGVSSEPPTPSFLPSFPASGVDKPKEGPAVPSYNFGLKKSAPSLVFAFPSTSSALTHDDASDLKFNFGSEETRISFSSIGKDAICY